MNDPVDAWIALGMWCACGLLMMLWIRWSLRRDRERFFQRRRRHD